MTADEHPCAAIDKPSPEQAQSAPAVQELCAESDPSIKISEKENKSKTTEKKCRGRPPSHGLSGKPIYKSYHEAKQRCTNSNHPDYAQYGGRGIEFRFKSVTELFDEIGDRPPDKTLDRINSNRHYERGNVRWADAKEQANNRRPASRYRTDWYGGTEIREKYLQAARHWTLSIAAMNDPTRLTSEEVAFLEERHAATSLPYATFWTGEHDNGPHYVVLPSINRPGAQSTLRVNPWLLTHNSRGLLSATEDIPLSANCSEEELQIINDFVNNVRTAETGLIYCGCNGGFSSNRIEGRLLATAGRLKTCGLQTRMVLSAKVASLLCADQSESLLQPGFLFLPDLDVWSSVFGSDRLLRYRLRQLLGEREAQRLPTIVYIENAEELGEEFVSLFACRQKCSLGFTTWLGPNERSVALRRHHRAECTLR
jgi:hypothetical protein